MQHVQLAPGLELFALSVDLCLQKQQGDLASECSRTFWLDRIHTGQICGGGGGPPCESWSAARYQDNGPRPLRSASYVYGLPSLSLREWKQTRVGTRLLHFLLEAVAALCPMGGFAFVEHPQYPTWLQKKEPPSIWSLTAVRTLRTLHCIGITSFDQCSVGAVAKKPTTILHLRLPRLRALLLGDGYGGRCRHLPGFHDPLCGRDGAGCFKTSRGKIYPQQLNQHLATAIADHISATYSGLELPKKLPEIFHPLVCNIFEDVAVVQPDCYT